MRTRILLIAFTGLLSISSVAQDATALRKKHFNLSKSGLAINGYDPVAYFKGNKAIEGKKDHAVIHREPSIIFHQQKIKMLLSRTRLLMSHNMVAGVLMQWVRMVIK